MSLSARGCSMLLTVVALSLTSCGISAIPAQRSAVAPPPPPLAVVGDDVPALAPAGIPGALPVSLRTDGATAVDAKWVYLNGAGPYNDQLDARLLGLLDKNADGRYNPALPDPAKPLMSNGLELDQDIILAGGTLLGTRLARSKVVNGNPSLFSVTTEFTDLANGAVHGGPALLSAEGAEGVRGLLEDAIPDSARLANPLASASTTATASAPASPTTTTPATATPTPLPIADMLAGAAFGPQGELVVPLMANPTDSSALAKPLTVRVSADAAAPLLSDFGRQVRSVTDSGSVLTPPAPARPGQEHINCDLVPCAALTYDDGPNEQTTRLLEILARHSVLATFFQQGSSAANYPAVAAAVAAAGHSIGNHTRNHPYLTKLSAGGVQTEVQGATADIFKATGVTTPFLRPPYGASNALVNNNVGMPMIDWSADSLDWQSRNKDVFIPKILAAVRPGGIVLQHDIHKTTIDGQEQLITTLQGMGYHLVTVPQLFLGIELQKGRSYFCRGTASPCTPGR